MRPYIICHMVASIDGRIDCSMVDKISGDEYYTTLEKLDCPSSLEGRVTMEHYNAEKEPFVPTNPKPLGKTDFHIATQSDSYTIAVDTHGRLRWPSDKINGVPLLCIVSESVSEEYIDMLCKKGISWIAVGKTAINLEQAMEILCEKFGIKRLVVLGGGHINGGFLAAGLLDEISLLLAPGIDGRKGQTALFDGIADTAQAPTSLRLESVEKTGEDVLWLRYHVK